MKRIFLSLLVLFGCTFPAGNSVEVGEKMVFSMWYNFMKAGVAFLKIESLDTINGRKAYRVVYEAMTTGVFDRVFKVRDFYKSWVDVQKFFSYGFVKNLREGKYRKVYDVRFDYRMMVAIAGRDTIPIDGHLNDPVSIFYYIRTLPLAEGEEFLIESFDNNRIRYYKIVVSDVKHFVTPYGKRECFILVPLRVDGSPFKYGGYATIYVDTERQIPVMIEAKLRFGSVKMKLEEYWKGRDTD